MLFKIFFIFALLIVILCLIKLKFEFGFNDSVGLIIRLKILFLNISISPSNRKKTSPKKIKSSKDKIKKEKKKKNKKKKFNIFLVLRAVVEPLPNFLKFLNRGFLISFIRFNIKVAQEDAHKTALSYSNISSIINCFVFLLGSICKVKEKVIDISPDFLNEKSSYDIFLDCNIRIGRVVVGAIIYMVSVIYKFFVLSFNKYSLKK